VPVVSEVEAPVPAVSEVEAPVPDAEVEAEASEEDDELEILENTPELGESAESQL
jgi:hypothetical protein